MTRRVLLSAEGQTEETFVRDILAPRLLAIDVEMKPVILATKRPASGGKFRGGATTWAQIQRDLVMLLRDSGVVAVTTMFDLYGLPREVPGVAASAGFEPYERVSSIERALIERFEDPRFRPYIQLHEFEALVYAAPDIAAERSGDLTVATMMRKAVAGGAELVNERPTTAPSKRIRKAWPGYLKSTDGPAILADSGLDRLRSSCPHFGEWLTWLESL